MKIQIDDISSAGLAVDMDSGAPEVRAALRTFGFTQARSSIRFVARLIRKVNLVDVSGRISGHVEMPCSRCLDPVALSIDDTFRFVLGPPLRGEETPEGVEIELTAEDLEYGFVEGGEIDVEALVQEQLALALPQRVLCRPDCRGICQGCGALLNHEPCRCEGPAGDERWAALESLRRR